MSARAARGAGSRRRRSSAAAGATTRATLNGQRSMRLAGSVEGLAIGIAAGFAAWLLQLRLADMPYHFGTVLDSTLVDDACIEAGMNWLVWSGAAALIGGFIGMIAGRLGPLERLMRLSAPASVGIYMLALRGAWGYGGPPPIAGAAAIVPVVMPAISILAPALLAVVVGTAILFLEFRAVPERHAGRGSAPAPALVSIHLCLSLTAALTTLQLPYYLGAAGGFLVGLASLIRTLPLPV